MADHIDIIRPRKRLPILIIVPEGEDIPSSFDPVSLVGVRKEVFENGEYGKRYLKHGLGSVHISDIQFMSQFGELLKDKIGETTFNGREPTVLKCKLNSFFMNVYKQPAWGKADTDHNTDPDYFYTLFGDRSIPNPRILINNFDIPEVKQAYNDFYDSMSDEIKSIRNEFGYCIVFLIKGFKNQHKEVRIRSYSGYRHEFIAALRDQFFTPLRAVGLPMTAGGALSWTSAPFEDMPYEHYHHMDNVFLINLGFSYDHFHTRQDFTPYMRHFADALSQFEEIIHLLCGGTYKGRIRGRLIYGDKATPRFDPKTATGKELNECEDHDIHPGQGITIKLCTLRKKEWLRYPGTGWLISLMAKLGIKDYLPEEAIGTDGKVITADTAANGTFEFNNVAFGIPFILKVETNGKEYYHIVHSRIKFLKSVSSFLPTQKTFNRGGDYFLRNPDQFRSYKLYSPTILKRLWKPDMGYPPLPIYIMSSTLGGLNHPNEDNVVVDLYDLKEAKQKKGKIVKPPKIFKYTYAWTKFNKIDDFNKFYDGNLSVRNLRPGNPHGKPLSNEKTTTGNINFADDIPLVPIYKPAVLGLGACIKGNEGKNEWKWDLWTIEEMEWEPEIIDFDDNELKGKIKRIMR
ncbi:hypothetical protein H6503_06290 [Candidatus Woesearchaeota archaeon]|nr:hypothetical protein [Candidatus Woesearchaeota archaeon]